MNEIVNMHGYGIYVWSAYFITLFVFAINLFLTLKEKRSIKKLLKEWTPSDLQKDSNIDQDNYAA